MPKPLFIALIILILSSPILVDGCTRNNKNQLAKNDLVITKIDNNLKNTTKKTNNAGDCLRHVETTFDSKNITPVANIKNEVNTANKEKVFQPDYTKEILDSFDNTPYYEQKENDYESELDYKKDIIHIDKIQKQEKQLTENQYSPQNKPCTKFLGYTTVYAHSTNTKESFAWRQKIYNILTTSRVVWYPSTAFKDTSYTAAHGFRFYLNKDLKVYDLFTYFVPYESIKVLDSKAWYIKANNPYYVYNYNDGQIYEARHKTNVYPLSSSIVLVLKNSIIRKLETGTLLACNSCKSYYKVKEILTSQFGTNTDRLQNFVSSNRNIFEFPDVFFSERKIFYGDIYRLPEFGELENFKKNPPQEYSKDGVFVKVGRTNYPNMPRKFPLYYNYDPYIHEKN